MTYSILLVVKKPDGTNYKIDQEYDNCVYILSGIEKQKRGLQMLTEGCALLPLDKGLQDVLDVLKAVRTLPYTYTILSEDTKWYEGISKV
jgi:hypothetical protein